MAAITNAELPTFATIEEVAVWAMEALSYLNPTLQIKTGDNTSQPYFSRATGLTSDGETIFYGSFILPINADYNIVTGKIWKKSKEVKQITVPAAFKTN
jgi:hypothetical protein